MGKRRKVDGEKKEGKWGEKGRYIHVRKKVRKRKKEGRKGKGRRRELNVRKKEDKCEK